MSNLKNLLSIKTFSKKSKTLKNFIIFKLQREQKTVNNKIQSFNKLLLKELNIVDFINVKTVKFPLHISYFSILKSLISFCLSLKTFSLFIKFRSYILLNIKARILQKILNIKRFAFYTLSYFYLKFFLITQQI